MPLPIDDVQVLKLGGHSIADFYLKLPRSTIRVLVVADTMVSTNELGGFGVWRFIRLLRETKLGCTRFIVDVARRDLGAFGDAGEAAAGDRYTGFRFDTAVGDDLVIDRYHEIFMFGFAPGNDAGPDDNIDNHPLVMSDTEKSAIDRWMDEGGGVFATGDHDYLGATMCHRIARVRSMRKWTNADGVPPISGPNRIDAHRPDTPAESSGTTVILGAETDATPQPIEWVPMQDYFSGLFRIRRPHEVLCHPRLGPIDVMPDHNHEGECFTRAEIEADDSRRAEFPDAELPQIIAWGNTLPDPPYQHIKGDTPAKHFAMISTYDGWRANVGRIVVDSTWHHWFNLNIEGLENAGGDDWQKIARYFVNVAKWIAPKGAYRKTCWWDLLGAHFHPRALEDLHRKGSVLELGTVMRKHLSLIHGPCTVREFILDSICERWPKLCGRLREQLIVPPGKNPCWTCPPIDVFEQVALGGMAKGTMQVARHVTSLIQKNEPTKIMIDEVEKAAMMGMTDAMEDFRKEVAKSLRNVSDMFGA